MYKLQLKGKGSPVHVGQFSTNCNLLYMVTSQKIFKKVGHLENMGQIWGNI